MTERPHRRLDVWKRSLELTRAIYSATALFPSEERFGLVSQMRRAAVSVASNIAEGASRWSNKERVQFYFTSRASLSELDTQLEISQELGFMDPSRRAVAQELLDRTSAMINGLIHSERNKHAPNRGITA